MSTVRATVSLQRSLWGGTDVIENFSRGRSVVHAATDSAAARVALELAVTEGALPSFEAPPVRAVSECPKCGHRGPTLEDFGTRFVRGALRPQSWCRPCRTAPRGAEAAPVVAPKPSTPAARAPEPSPATGGRAAGHRLVVRASVGGQRVAVAWVFLRADLSGGVADLTLPDREPLRGLPVFPFERGASAGTAPADPQRVGAPMVRNLVVRSKDESGRWRTFAWLCVRTDGLGGLADLTLPGEASLTNLQLAPLGAPRV